MKFFKLPIYALAAALITAPTIANAWWWHWDDDDDEEIPFDVARLFFELNDTDGDLGIHGDIDGDDWKKVEIEDPKERRMMLIRANGRLKRQGVTEFSFESAEPCFPDDEECEDPLDPEDFFARFPEGKYEIEGKTLDGEELESEVELSHVIPAAPANLAFNGVPAAEDCDADPLPEVDPEGGVTISWDAVTKSHEDLGRDTDTDLDDLDVEVIGYEVVVEIDESPLKTVANVPAGVTEWTFSEDFFDLSEEGEYKVEILGTVSVEDDDDGEPIPGNRSAVETCFEAI